MNYFFGGYMVILELEMVLDLFDLVNYLFEELMVFELFRSCSYLHHQLKDCCLLFATTTGLSRMI